MRATIRVLRLLFAASVLVPALLLGAIALNRHAAALREATDSVSKTTRILQEHALKVLETHELVLDRIQGRLTGLDNETIRQSADIKDFLRRLDEPRDQIASLWIIGPDGLPLSSSIPWRETLTPRVGDDFEAQRLVDAGTFIGKGYRGQTTGTQAFSISRRRQLADGTFNGTLHLAVSTAYFRNFFQSAAPDQSHIALLLREDGEVLATDISADHTEDLAVAVDWARSPFSQQPGFARWTSPSDGVERLMGAAKVGAFPIYVAYGIDKRTALAPWYDDLKLYGGIALAASLSLCFVTLLALRHAQQEALVIERLDLALQQSEKSQSALHQALKMEAVGQLTGGIAHDFNNLLTVIAGNLALLQARFASDEKSVPWMAAAQRAADRAAKLTAQLLAFARKQQLVAEPVDLNRIVAGMSGLLRSAVGGTATVETSLAKELWPANGDISQIELVILNLAINARDAMGDRGKIRIETANTVEPAPSRPEDPPAGEHVVVSLIDTGVGIPPHVLNRVFEPFFTTKEVGKGSGLGLAQVLGVAQQLGGGVRILSTPGEGTEVRVYLPRASQAVAPEADEPLPRLLTVPRKRTARILVVDDEEDVRRLTGAALRQAGHEVMELDGGRAALDWLESEGYQAQLLVLDFAMPDMDGAELARQIRQKRPTIPILFVTGFADAAALATEARPGDILRKPFRTDELLARVDKILSGAVQSA